MGFFFSSTCEVVVSKDVFEMVNDDGGEVETIEVSVVTKVSVFLVWAVAHLVDSVIFLKTFPIKI